MFIAYKALISRPKAALYFLFLNSKPVNCTYNSVSASLPNSSLINRIVVKVFKLGDRLTLRLLIEFTINILGEIPNTLATDTSKLNSLIKLLSYEKTVLIINCTIDN